MRRILFATIGSLLVLGCNGIPKKPDIDLCTIDWPAQEAICAQTADPGSPPIRKPLSDFDRATTLVPSDWERVQLYIHELEEYAKDAERRCKP